MRGLGNVEEVLRVAAPELVFLAVLSHFFVTSSLGTPLDLELLLNSSWKLDYIDLLRGKDAQEDGSFLLFLVLDLSEGCHKGFGELAFSLCTLLVSCCILEEANSFFLCLIANFQDSLQEGLESKW